MRRSDERGENYAANVRAIAQLTGLAESKGIPVTQLALAWLLHQGEDIVPIPGTRTRLAVNVASVDVTLTPAELHRVHEILPHGSYGSRYAAEYMPEWAAARPASTP
jgi:aryl-alcohol dehydrogenase-like predicted oxidoreductase